MNGCEGCRWWCPTTYRAGVMHPESRANLPAGECYRDPTPVQRYPAAARYGCAGREPEPSPWPPPVQS